MTGANEKLGLPRRDGMEKLIYAFDVDGTLILSTPDGDLPQVPIINTLQVLSKLTKNVRIVVWSGGGKQYAEMWGRRLGLDEYVWRYASKLEHEEIRKFGRIIAIDDIQDTAIGDVNVIVKLK